MAESNGGYNHWLIAGTVTIASFMEVLDTTIANVSLPYIAGDLAVSEDEASWILTTYLVANAVVLPASGWISGLIGRKRFYMACVLIFTISSALCGLAPNLPLLLLFRVIQGAGGGGLQPSEQGILLDTFPGKQRGMAMAVYGVAILFAPIIGPTLGGFITENYDWRWIFYINVPVGALSLFLTNMVVRDPPWMDKERQSQHVRWLDLDWLGLGLIALGLGSLEIIYDRGQENDWFNSRLIIVLLIFAIVSLGTAIVWELRHPRPIVNLRFFQDRNFAAGSIVIYSAFAIIYGSNVLLPLMLQNLFGYDAYTAGLIMSPGGIAVMVFMPVSGYLLGRGFDARMLIFFGLLSVAAASYWTAHLTLEASPEALVVRRCAQLFGMGFVFAPVNTAAYLYLPKEQTSNATGLFNLVRNEGASLGIAVYNTLLARRSQFHQNRLVGDVSDLRLPFREFREQLLQQFHLQGFDLGTAGRMALDQIYQIVQHQAEFMSYLDLFWVFAVAGVCAAPLVFLMRRSVTNNEEPAAA